MTIEPGAVSLRAGGAIAASTITATGAITAGGDISTTFSLVGRSGNASQTRVGNMGPAGQAGIEFGSAGDTNLYRSAADQLKTDDRLNVGGLIVGSAFVYAYDGSATSQTRMGQAGPSNEAGIVFGSALDTNLYRSAADTLKTDDQFFSAAQIVARIGIASQVSVGQAGPSAEAGIVFGSSGDTNIYRSAANTLKTDDQFYGGDDIYARVSAATQVHIGAVGPASEAGIAFGSADDVSIFRSGADVWRTNDLVQFGNNTTVFQLKGGSNTQTTVGAAGAATVLPALPLGYMKAKLPDGTDIVFPYYTAA